MDGAALEREAKNFGIQLKKTQLEAFALFEKKLYEANKVMNLTRVPQEECWKRHFLDSLCISPLISKNAHVLDIGSGGGLPGVALAIARDDLYVTCLDSSNKSVGFLSQIFGARGSLPVLFAVILGRAEEVAHDARYREKYDIVTGRALAPLALQAELSAGFVKVGGVFLPMRTPREIQDAKNLQAQKLGMTLTDLKSISIPPLNAVRLIPVYKKQGRTPAEFPRAWAKIKTSPLGTVSAMETEEG